MTDRHPLDLGFELRITLILATIGAVIAAPAWALLRWARR